MASQSVDDLIACLIGMGFELEDAQAAVQAGRLTPEAAIEWIVSGKPVVSASSGSNAPLRLHRPGPDQVIGANPFSNPQQITTTTESGSKKQAASDVPEEESDALVSRTHMTDEQRKIRDRFEEKQRDEARKHAVQDRVAKKKAHSQILKQIQEDREMQKLRKGPPSASAPQELGSSPDSSKDNENKPESAATPGPSSPKKASCLLQIRLPDSRALRQNFDPNAHLKDVWDFVCEKLPASTTSNMCLMQPFPRVEYGPNHMKQSLQELNLVPSGSLVLQKKAQATQVPPGESMETEAAYSSGNESPGGASGENVPKPPDLNHHWGSGNKMVEELLPVPLPEPIPGDGDIDMVEDSEDDESDDDMGGAVGGNPQPMPPMWGGGGWGPNQPPIQGIVGMDHMWGEGQRLVGEVLNADNLPHRKQDPKQLAAEAARQRFARVPEASNEEAAAVSVVTHDVPALVQTIIQHISRRISDSRNPLLGLQGLPADIAMKVLDYLIHEKLLRPKTLQPFVTCRLRKLILDCYPYTTNELMAALRFHVYLTHLSLRSCPLITDHGLEPLRALKRLRILNLGSCTQLTNNCIPILSEFEQLNTVILEDTGVTDDGITEYARLAPQVLESLNLNRTNVTQQVFIALQHFTNLRSLGLEQTKVASLSGIQNLTKLETLNLCGTLIVTDSLLCLSNHPSLTALNIANTNSVQGDLALQYISGLKLQLLQLPNRHSTSDVGMQFLTGMPLHTLDLTNYRQVGDTGAEHIGKIKSLRKLRLTNTGITDAGMLFLANLKHLEELYVDRTVITDHGASIIREFPHLYEVSLAETGISDQTLIDGVLPCCPLLTKVNLSKTIITKKGVSCLVSSSLSLLNLDHTRVAPEAATVALSMNCPQLVKVSLNNVRPVQNDDDS